MNGGGLIGKVFGTGDAAPVNAAIFVLILAALLAVGIAVLPLNTGLSPEQMLHGIGDIAGMCLAFIFGRVSSKKLNGEK